MLKQILITALLMTTAVASAKELSAQDIRDRYQLNADVYTVDVKRIISGPEATNYWRPDRETGVIKGDWSSDSGDREFALRYHFQVLDDNSIQAVIEEYGSQSPGQSGPEFKDLLEKKEFALTNLEPIVWKIKNNKGHNQIVRFYVSMREVSKPISVDNLPVAGTGISVSDNAGFLWAEGVEFNGRYVGLTSHRGTLALSKVTPLSLPNGYTIRRGSLDDLDAAIELDLIIQRAQEQGPSFSLNFPNSQQRNEWTETLEDPDVTHLFVESNGLPIAQCATFALPQRLGSFPETVHLSAVSVRDDHQRRGIARAMVSFALHHARSQGFIYGETNWRVTNRYAAHYWTNFGFTPTYTRLQRRVGTD